MQANSRSKMVDWDFAVTAANKMVGPGPEISKAEASAVVAELRAGAERSTGLVANFTGLHAAAQTAPVLVVDRRGWVQANIDSFSKILSPAIDKMLDGKVAESSNPLVHAVGSRIAGGELGLILGFMGSKVLGQFDPFHQVPGEDGRLLLVAPNIVHTEREIGANPHDFRLWVCLHEETHRVQFTAVPWMRDYMNQKITEVTSLMNGDPSQMLGDGLKRIGELVSGNSGGSLFDLMASPQQRELVDQITGVMSLLEGHADVVMDGVGPEVIPSVAEIRAKFTERRKGMGMMDKILRRLLGLEQKMAQYRDGAIFVRAVIDKIGMDGFNQVWAGPENLPSKAEILAPELWLARVPK